MAIDDLESIRIDRTGRPFGVKKFILTSRKPRGQVLPVVARIVNSLHEAGEIGVGGRP